MIATMRVYLSLVRFSHSVFALPFALMSAWLAAGGVPGARTLLLVVGCAVAARTAAMAFNRLVDREIDAKNPRTARRELPAGALGVGQVRALVVIASAAFIAMAFALNELSGVLSLPVLVILLGYSYAKRFTAAVHLVLGVALALAPLGAWIAVRGDFAGDLAVPLLLAAAVMTWVAGFDVLYALQDESFDRTHGLRSIPARFGVAKSLTISSALHVATVASLAALWWRAGLGTPFAVGVAGSALLLAWEHRLVKPGDLSRLDTAFFTLNGWMGVGLFAALATDLALS
jgi:4-hydroxybenzoate polyprenyltransferase